MRVRAIGLLAVLLVSSELSAQVLRLPRPKQTPENPAPLPPQAEPVSRSLAFRRSRWSTEGYTVISRVQAPTTNGGVSSYNTFGAGTRGDYRFTDRFSATLDVTASPLGGSSSSETAEVGGSFSPLSWDSQVRPFFDLRAVYMHVYDTFIDPMAGTIPSSQSFVSTGRYARGLGAVSGAGIEYSITPRFALTNEITALRNRMTTYHLTGQESAAGRTVYWMTSVRYAIGLKFTPVTALH